MTQTANEVLVDLFRLVGVESADVLDTVSFDSGTGASEKGDKGDKGDPGPQGDPGPPGAPGDAAQTYVYSTNGLATTTPTMAHNFGHYPQVEVTDNTSGQRIGFFACTFPTVNTAIVSLLSARNFTVTMI